MTSDRIFKGQPIVTSVVHRAANRNDLGDWLLVIKHGSSVQHLKLDVDGRAEKADAVVKAEAYLAACGVTVAA